MGISAKDINDTSREIIMIGQLMLIVMDKQNFATFDFNMDFEHISCIITT